MCEHCRQRFANLLSYGLYRQFKDGSTRRAECIDPNTLTDPIKVDGVWDIDADALPDDRPIRTRGADLPTGQYL